MMNDQKIAILDKIKNNIRWLGVNIEPLPPQPFQRNQEITIL